MNKNNNKYILNGKSDSELILLILDKRTNYNKMSIRSLEKICKQIGSKEIIKIEEELNNIAKLYDGYIDGFGSYGN